MRRLRPVADWLPAVLLVPAAVIAGVVASVPDDDLAAMREVQPFDLGTTWVYDVYDHGEPSGTRTSQVVRPASQADDSGGLLPVTEVIGRYTDYPGSGPRELRSYLGIRGSTMLQYAQEEAGTRYPIEPPITAYRVPVEEGASWSYDGSVGDVGYVSHTEVTEIEDVEVGGRTFEGCAHFTTEVTLSLDDDPTNDPDSVDLLEEWTCPDYGTVRIRTRNEAGDLDVTEELTEFHGVEANWYAAGHEPDPTPVPGPVAGSTYGFGPGRTFALPDGVLGRELAWTELRRERALHPPVSDGEVMVAAERNGAVSLRTVGTGQMEWQLRLRGPILTAPVIAGNAVVVADSRKRVWALDVEDGRALWVSELPDVASASPVVVGDQVVVPSDDGTLTSLALRDGSSTWATQLDGAVRNAVAYDGEHVLSGDRSGTLTALVPHDGEVSWSVSFDTGLAQGPVVLDRRILVLDGDGVVHAFSAEGDIEWQSRGRGVGDMPMAAGNGVVVTMDFGQLSALDGETGRRLWLRDLPVDQATSAIVGEEVVVGLEDGEVLVYDLRDGRLADRWRLPPASAGDRWSNDVVPALIGDDLVLTAFANGETDTVLFAYPTSAGRRPGARLSVSHRQFLASPSEPAVLAGDDIVMSSSSQVLRIAPDGSATVLSETPGSTHPGVVVTGEVVITRVSGSVQALRLRDGKLLWEAPGGEPSLGSVPATDGTTAFYGITDLGLAAVDVGTGKVRWASPVPGQRATTTPTVLASGDVIYGGGGLARYDGATGEEKWRLPEAQLFGPAAYAGGTVYAATIEPGSEVASLGAYDAATGEQRWAQPMAELAPFLGPAVGDGVVVSIDGRAARTYDATSGKELWSIDLLRAPYGSPVVADGRVLLVQSGNGWNVEDDEYRVSVHDARTGDFVGAWQVPGAQLSTRPQVGSTPDGRLLVPELGMTVLEVLE